MSFSILWTLYCVVKHRSVYVNMFETRLSYFDQLLSPISVVFTHVQLPVWPLDVTVENCLVIYRGDYL